jgi:glucosyl-3-phosphoglycerate synthase
VTSAASSWFESATTGWADWSLDVLRAAKNGTNVAVVIPARNEEATIGEIVDGIREELTGRNGLVDELVVIDSDSRDNTAAVANDHGATVHAASSIRPDLGRFPGKGEALWKSQFVTSADVLVFIDADLTEWGPHFVTGLLGPMLTNANIHLVKGFYDRVLDDAPRHQAPQGGRVTELVARPVLNLWCPELSRVVQPLAGEWAVRRSAFEQQSVPTGYGVEIATLLDVHRRDGLAAIAQVDLGERAHSHQSVHDLGVMAAELLAVVSRRLGHDAWKPEEDLWQFDRTATPQWRARTVPLTERPPARAIGEALC